MKEIDYGRIGMRIRQVRKTKGWSQDVLAKKCGISMSFLGHIERGTRIMSLDTFVRICSELEAGADELLFGVPHPSDAVLDLWNPKEQRIGDDADAASDQKPDKKNAANDSYSMYVKIMKSVAEIMSEA